MIWIDYAILAIVGISGVISLMRGFVREALSLAGWIAAFWLAIAFSGEAAVWLEGYVTVPSVRVGIAFAVLFIGVLLLCGIALRLAGLLIDRTGMSGTDRTLGIVFGVLRGIVITGVLVLLAGLTPLPRDPWWSQSVLLPRFVELAQEIRTFLPEDVQQQIGFELEIAIEPKLDVKPEIAVEPKLDAKPEPTAEPKSAAEPES